MPRLSSRLASPSGVGLPGDRPCTLRPAKTSSDQRLLTASRLSRLPQKRELEAKLYGPSGDVVKTFEDDAVIDQVPASADEKLEVTSSTHSLATGLVNEGTIDVKNTAVLKASSSAGADNSSAAPLHIEFVAGAAS